MRFALSLALIALPSVALAEDGTSPTPTKSTTVDKAIIGGGASPAGKWPDAAALLWGGEQLCTGTLIAPTVVLTAGHCVLDGKPGYVVVGSTVENGTQGGEKIRVLAAYEYPVSQGTVDGGVVTLETPATTPPRPIATGWAKFDIKNGASVALVGFGTTDRDGNVDSPTLLEAMTTISDSNCTKSSGCNSAARPDGELGAGGMGIDTCPGDSGGPLYLMTSYGNFVAGITSRGYDSNNYYCSEGGIYARPDKIVDWIEMMTETKVSRGPEPTADMITVERGNAGEVTIAVNDPKSESHTFTITKPPAYGKAAVSDKGVVRVCAQKDVIGGDALTVAIADAADATRTLEVVVNVQIEDGDPADDCDETAFGEDSGGGCCDTRRSANGSIPLVLFVALVLRRRRRAR